MKSPSLSRLLEQKKFPSLTKAHSHGLLDSLQLEILRIQQGIWHQKKRAIIVFEGFDAAGKGGAIRRLVEKLDPRGFHVYPIGPPESREQSRHYLYRFWKNIPPPGTLAIFDRSWYGRVLVERVEKLVPKQRWIAAYKEIQEFESLLQDDGIAIVKIFLAIDKKEQLRRFKERLADPYKRWKLASEDVEARAKWDEYVEATDDMFKKTSTKSAPWHLVAANDKHYTRVTTLKIVSRELGSNQDWIESQCKDVKAESLKDALKRLGLTEKSLK